MHEIIFKKISTHIAGALRNIPVRLTGSPVPCPNYVKVPTLMDELVNTITTSQEHVATLAAQAHFELARIHPFIDGNGRTARLLMNLLLLQEGYPLTIIDVKDRTAYINAIQKALVGETADYYNLIYAAIEHSLDEYIAAARESKLT